MPQFSQPIQNVPPGTHTIPVGAGPGGTAAFTRATVADGASVDLAGEAACESGSALHAAQAARMTASTIERICDVVLVVVNRESSSQADNVLDPFSRGVPKKRGSA